MKMFHVTIEISSRKTRPFYRKVHVNAPDRETAIVRSIARAKNSLVSMGSPSYKYNCVKCEER